MGWIPVHEDIKVPVFKNIIYALKILYKCHKPFMFWQILAQCSYMIFTLFIQSVLFLKVLLSVVEGVGDFTYYVKMLMIFFAVGVLSEVIQVVTDYKGLVGHKIIFKSLNNMIFEKATKVDISCYEDPEFYDKYQRATEILTGGLFSAFSYTFATLIGGRNIKDEIIKSHRNRFSAVFQDFQLFAATLGENVALDMDYNENEVMQALKHSGFDKELPNGVNTEALREFDDGGMMFSGGEAQKITVARTHRYLTPWKR